jgi:hypothetical protein
MKPSLEEAHFIYVNLPERAREFIVCLGEGFVTAPVTSRCGSPIIPFWNHQAGPHKSLSKLSFWHAFPIPAGFASSSFTASSLSDQLSPEHMSVPH